MIRLPPAPRMRVARQCNTATNLLLVFGVSARAHSQPQRVCNKVNRKIRFEAASFSCSCSTVATSTEPASALSWPSA